MIINILRLIKENLIFTALFFLTISVFSILPFHCNSLNPIREAIFDFDISDIIFSKLRTEQRVDTNIVLINIGELHRKDLYKMIKRVNNYNPKIVALDIIFEEPKEPEIDSLLQKELKKCKNLVMVSKLIGYNGVNGSYSGYKTSLNMFIENAKLGYGNLPESSKPNSYTIRDFVPFIKYKTNTIYSFSSVISKIFDSVKYDYLLSRNNNQEIINYRGNFNKFFHIDYDGVLDSSVDLSFIKDKIVMFGFMGRTKSFKTFEDIYFTPMNDKYAGKSFPDMYGVVIQANIVSAILNRNYIDKMSKFLNIIFSVIVCYLNVWFVLFLRKLKNNKNNNNPGDISEMYHKLAVVYQLVFFLIIGFLCYVFFNYKLDLTLMIFAVLFVPLIISLYSSLYRSLLRHFNKVKA